MSLFVMTATLPAVLPDPPAPPTEELVEPLLDEKDAPTEKPPEPPPPPTDWAKMPFDAAPLVTIASLVSTVTLPAAPPRLPAPPPIFESASPSSEMPAPTENPPRPPPPPTDCASTPLAESPDVAIPPIAATITSPDAPPAPPPPPTASVVALPFDEKPAPIVKPPAPPPPPTDWANTPLAPSPSVEIRPAASTCTAPPVPAAPPAPPPTFDSASFSSATPAPMAKPPEPPPPPTDCAKMPLAFAPSVPIWPMLDTATEDALPAAPPPPPTWFDVASFSDEKAPPTAKPPAPPPPPTDCARMPFDPVPMVNTVWPAIAGVAPVAARTVTRPASLPLPPFPPTPCVLAFPSIDAATATESPPDPPPPPTDWAKMPLARLPWVWTVPMLDASTVPAVPPSPPAPEEPRPIDWPLIVALSNRLMPPLPPPPPTDCAWMPLALSPAVVILPAEARSTLPAALPVPPVPPTVTPTAFELPAASDPEKPPLPPPPPTDCANSPTLLVPNVETSPVLRRWTLPAVAPAPPPPPSAIAAAPLVEPERRRAGNREAAVAAAAAHRLGKRAIGLDSGGGQVPGAVDRDVATFSSVAARAAERQRARRIVRPGHRNREAAVAAAAADRLRKDSVRQVAAGENVAPVRHDHIAGRSAGPRSAAEAERQRGIFRARRRDREAAVAAAAADRLRGMPSERLPLVVILPVLSR